MLECDLGLMVIALLAFSHIAITWAMAILNGIVARRNPPDNEKTPGRWPFVSVIVPAWNERGTVESCIHSLCAVEYPTWEAIIVAGGPDGTYQAAVESCEELDHVHVLEQQPRGKNAALNQGLRAARGEIIVLLDADSLVSPGWLRALVAPTGQSALATTGNPVPLRRTPISLCEQMERIAAWGVHDVKTLQGSGSIALQRTVIEQMGGFPEDVLVGVDWDLDVRLAARGVARAFCPQAHLYTERPATLPEYWRNEVRWRRAHLASLFRHAGFFLGSPAATAVSLYIYALSWFTALFTLLISVVALTGADHIKTIVIGLWVVFIGWVLLRRAALAAEVAAYTRDPGWLKLTWVPPLLLCVTLAAIVPASLTLKRTSAHFKGPRLHRYGDRAG